MADLNVIYRIAADISGLQDGVKRAADSAQGLETTFNRIGAAIAGALTVGAVVNFGKALIDDADALVKLHDKTQISLGGLQRFQVAGDDAGVSIESMARAVNKVQDLMAGNDRSFLAALSKVGIELEKFKALKPEDQYIAISDALRQVQDPAERVNLAIDLMGKLGAENLPVLIRGFDDLKDSSVGMSDEAVLGLDALGDAITRTWRAMKNLVGETIAMKVINSDTMRSGQALLAWYKTFTDTNEDLARALGKVPPPVQDMHAAFQQVNLSTAEQSSLERQLGEDLKETNKTRKDATDSARKLTEEHEKARQKMHDLMWATRDYERTMAEVARLGRQVAIPTIEDMATANERFGVKVKTGSDAMRMLGDMMEELPDQAGPMREAVRKAGVEVQTLATKITGHLTEALQRMPQIFIDAFTGGGGVIGALKGIGVSLLNAIMKEILDPIMASVARWAVKIGQQILGAFGVSIPGLGAGAGGIIAGGVTPGIIGGGGGAGVVGGGVGAGAGIAGAIGAGLLAGGILGGIALWSGGWGEPGVAPWWQNPDTGEWEDVTPTIRDPFADDEMLSFAAGSGGVRDFGAGQLAMLHGREAVVPENQMASGGHSAALLSVVSEIRDAMMSGARISVQVDGRELVKANIRTLDAGSDGLTTQFREVLGVA